MKFEGSKTDPVRAERKALLGIAIVSLIVLAIVALIAIPILARVLGEATRRNPDRPEGEGSDEPKPRERDPE